LETDNLCDCLDEPAITPKSRDLPDVHNRQTCINSPIPPKYLAEAATPGVCASYADTLIAVNAGLKEQVRAKNAPFCAIFMLKAIDLPRSARDKHREASTQKAFFSQGIQIKHFLLDSWWYGEGLPVVETHTCYMYRNVLLEICLCTDIHV
jgi:hypothetical protein